MSWGHGQGLQSCSCLLQPSSRQRQAQTGTAAAVGRSHLPAQVRYSQGAGAGEGNPPTATTVFTKPGSTCRLAAVGQNWLQSLPSPWFFWGQQQLGKGKNRKGGNVPLSTEEKGRGRKDSYLLQRLKIPHCCSSTCCGEAASLGTAALPAQVAASTLSLPKSWI